MFFSVDIWPPHLVPSPLPSSALLQDCKNRDILPQLGRKFVKEASERAADKRLALIDLAGVEYSVSLARRDVPRIFFDVNEGIWMAVDE